MRRKCCKLCSLNKCISNFGKTIKTFDGRKPSCKDCLRLLKIKQNPEPSVKIINKPFVISFT